MASVTHPAPDYPDFTTIIYVMMMCEAYPAFIPYGGLYKIGITSNLPSRFASIQGANPDIELAWVSKPCRNKDARYIEGLIHLHLRESRLRRPHAREWFRLNGNEACHAQSLIVKLVEKYRQEAIKAMAGNRGS